MHDITGYLPCHWLYQIKGFLPPVLGEKGVNKAGKQPAHNLIAIGEIRDAVFRGLFNKTDCPKRCISGRDLRDITMVPGTIKLPAFTMTTDNIAGVTENFDLSISLAPASISKFVIVDLSISECPTKSTPAPLIMAPVD